MPWLKRLITFWNKVEANLRAGDWRLLFVADELPPQLRRLIEFLNEHFTRIEVLGVELRQYVGQGVKALVPRVIGQSEAAREQKVRSSPSRSAGSAVRLNRETFLSSCPPESVAFFAKVLDEAETRGLEVRWASESFLVYKKGQFLDFFRCKIGGYLELFVRDLSEEVRSRFLGLAARPKGSQFTIKIPVTRETLSDAQRAWNLALQTAFA